MRPGHIRVFDGLRVTTEHFDHFQGSLHSAIQDIRGILGLGVVYSGFGVTATDANTISVQPGLAFDQQGNRVSSDEPKTVHVAFDSGTPELFACVKYDQVEEGQTEGHFTLIWDSCAIVLRPSMPSPEDNLIPIAKLSRAEDGDLKVDDPHPAVPETPAPASPESPQASIRLKFQQGVVRLETTTPLAEVLGSQTEAAFPVVNAEVSFNASVCSLTCHTVISAALASEPPQAEVKLQSVSSGEATVESGEIAQFGVTGFAIDEGSIAHLSFANAEGLDEMLKPLELWVRLEKRNGTSVNVACMLTWAGNATEELVKTLEEQKTVLRSTAVIAWKSVGETRNNSQEKETATCHQH